MISILILSLNEESNIRECINSISWSDDVVVFDSFSTDNTTIIAEEMGARIVRRKFDNWSSHQNWAVRNIDFKYPWVFYIDADERCTPDLAEEIKRVVTLGSDMAACRVRRKDYFMGKWLKHAQLYPTWIIRLFRPEKVRYERLVNPVVVVDGKIGELLGHLDHYPFSHGVAHWVDRHNRYSTFEAVESHKSQEQLPPLLNMISTDPNVRRHFQKELFFRLPGRPLIKFIYYYFIRRGFIEGYPGFIYCALQAIYEFLIEIKRVEIRLREKRVSL